VHGLFINAIGLADKKISVSVIEQDLLANSTSYEIFYFSSESIVFPIFLF
jgi:hypothetical protein